MSWKTTDTDQARHSFIAEFLREERNVVDLAESYGISRKTAYKWIGRFKSAGWAGLKELSRAPRHHPNALGADLERRVLECKARWPKWGAPKLFIKLRAQLGPEGCPSESSISRILQRHGMVRPQGRRRGLSIWWLKLDIRLERSRPGCPQDNGRHERMHRTLKAETAQPAQANLVAQQRAFDAFRAEYNKERPHEGLGGQTPVEVYTPSPRNFPARLPEIAYARDWEERQVRGAGQMKWKNRDVYITTALAGERIGLEPIEGGVWMVYFAKQALGIFDE